MFTRELRAEARIPVLQRGKLSVGENWFPCVVLDMSNSGFQMVCNNELAVGQIFDFRCELYPGKFLECMIEVMHSSEDTVGTMITEIDPAATSLLQAYLEEKFAIKLEDKPRKPAV
jgi:PilZ domain-containing protein